jgi:hypothetical protein
MFLPDLVAMQKQSKLFYSSYHCDIRLNFYSLWTFCKRNSLQATNDKISTVRICSWYGLRSGGN